MLGCATHLAHFLVMGPIVSVASVLSVWALQSSLLLGQDAEHVQEMRERILAAERLAENTPVRWLSGHVKQVYRVIFSSDGNRLASSGNDGTLWLWDAWTGDALGQLGYHNGTPRFTFNSTGESLLVEDPDARTVELRDGRNARLLVRMGEGDEQVHSAAFTADGDFLLVGLQRGSVVWVDARTGSATTTRLEMASTPIDLQVSRDGELALARCEDGRILVFEVAGGRLRQTLDRGLLDARFSYEGRRLLAKTQNDDPVWWDLQQEEIHEIEGEWASTHWNPNGATFLALDARGLPTLWDADTGTEIGPLDGVVSAVQKVMFDERGDVFLTLCASPQRKGRVADRADLWDAATCEQVSSLEEWDGVPVWNHSAFSADGTRYFAVDGFGPDDWEVARVWDVATGQLVQTLERNEGPPFFDLDIAPDNRRVALAAGSGIYLWEPPEPRATMILGTALPGFGGALLSPSGESAASFGAGGIDREVWSSCRIWNTANGQETHALADTSRFSTSAAFDSGARVIVSGLEGGHQLTVFDLATGNPVLVPEAGPSTWAIFSANGRRILSQPYRGGLTHLWDAESGEHLRTFSGVERGRVMKEEHYLTLHQFSPDGLYGASALADGRIMLWDPEYGERLGFLARHSGRIKDLEFSPDSTLLASAGTDGTVMLWDVELREAVEVLRGHAGAVVNVEFHADGERLVSAGEDGTVRVWRLGEEQPQLVIQASDLALQALDISADGSRLLTTGREVVASVWNLDTGDLRCRLEGHTASVEQGEFFPDGRRILTSSEDGTHRIWDADDGTLLLTRVEYSGLGWLAFEPQGHYVSGHGGADQARIEFEGSFYPLSSFAAFLENPEKVAASVRGEPVAPTRLRDRPPQIEIVEPFSGVVERRTFQLEVLVRDPVGIETVRVWQDGVELAQETVAGGLALNRSRNSGNLLLRLEIPPRASDTTLRVRATNSRHVQSRIGSTRLQLLSDRPSLYILAFGVADYDDDNLDLAYPVHDVDGIIDAFRAQEGVFYDKVEVLRLVDREVTTAAIHEARERFLLRAGPQDTIVVFAAGHGVATEFGEYWFLTSTATQRNPYSGIDHGSLNRLVTWPKLRARRKLLLIDTCFSGIPDVRGIAVGALEPGVLDEGPREGIYILAATCDDQFAREQQGHGYFTAAVLQALGGDADRTPYGNGNGFIEIDELRNLVTEEVRKRSGGRQQPSSPLTIGGENFRVGKVRE